MMMMMMIVLPFNEEHRNEELCYRPWDWRFSQLQLWLLSCAVR